MNKDECPKCKSQDTVVKQTSHTNPKNPGKYYQFCNSCQSFLKWCSAPQPTPTNENSYQRSYTDNNKILELNTYSNTVLQNHFGALEKRLDILENQMFNMNQNLIVLTNSIDQIKNSK